MTAAQPAGATSHGLKDWHAIDWRAVNQNVRRLQARMVKAEQEGRRGKVNALQRLLTRSFSGKALAVRRVTENQGKRTAGVDGVTWDTPEQKASAIHSLRQHGYQPKPLRRVYIAEPRHPETGAFDRDADLRALSGGRHDDAGRQRLHSGSKADSRDRS